MPTSEALRAGDVVIVPFPFTDRFAERRRPALVVSVPSLNASGMIWVVMITAAKRSAMARDFEIHDPRAAGLSAKCSVRPSKIASMEAPRVIRRAGKLARGETARALASVRGFIAADPAISAGRKR